MRLKRLAASVSASFDDFVAKVENHEAVADCLIDEVRQAAARVRVQHARAQTRIARLQEQRRDLDADLARWNERAARLAARDEAQALECLRRSRRAEARLSTVEAQLGEHLRLADDLGERKSALEQRLNDLQLRRTTLSSRAASAQSTKRGRRACDETAEAIFDRWETAVVADEYLDEASLEPTDALERTFRDAEEAAELHARLAALKTTAGDAS